MASLSQGRTVAAQCGLFTHKSVPVIFEPPCIYSFFSLGLFNPDDKAFKTSSTKCLAQPHPRQVASSATLLSEPKILHLLNLLVFPKLQLTLYYILFQLCVDGILNSVQKPDIMRCNQRYCHTTTPSSSCTAHAVNIILGKIGNCVI